ncbi:MAG: hypothetical protein V4489_05935 [Chlamydiota bacterium]
MRFLFIFLCVSVSAFSSLSVYNDSAFPLRIKVIGANGVHIAEKQVPSHIQMYIEDQIGTSDPIGQGESNSSFKNYSNSLTPYQVYWYCLDGTIYSSCMDAAAGATISANTCAGSYSCPCSE